MASYRVKFRILQSNDLKDELERLAKIISQKYKKDIRISLKEVKRQ